ncbi:DUF4105 domain-containing protein [Flavobacterium agricola]|uniref:DUF4105 domain-containing protein n=1 Tax=Flavobacterium agricola TaxID=2870839 RepID=A0ABY6LYJ6_9FLAO|nr:DUF4105 domain-containing protein [Flavobacterium agricola]UYW00495.1 DUF4105 domain-containing protein [Flavobacterium agricola]
MNKAKKLFLFVAFFMLNLAVQAQKIELSPQAEISILTCGTSNELHSLFGHTGIRIKDKSKHIDWVYNFGAFDFRAPNFYGKFLKGDLLYFIGKDDFNSFLFNYQAENRSVWEQPLQITQQQKQAIFDELTSTYGTEKALYTYKFIDKNCTTLAVNLIANNTGIDFNLQLPDAENLSNREILNTYLKNDYLVGMGINLLFGIKTDQTFNHIFLPEQFLTSIASTTINNKKISDETILHFEATPTNHSQLIVILAITGICIIIGLLSYNKSVALLTYALVGLLSLFLFGMQLYSFHSEVHFNYNLLLINPLFLVAGYLLATNQLKKYKALLQVLLVCLVLYVIMVVYNGYLFMVFPVTLAVFITLLIQIQLHKKIQP